MKQVASSSLYEGESTGRSSEKEWQHIGRDLMRSTKCSLHSLACTSQSSKYFHHKLIYTKISMAKTYRCSEDGTSMGSTRSSGEGTNVRLSPVPSHASYRVAVESCFRRGYDSIIEAYTVSGCLLQPLRCRMWIALLL